MNSGLLTSLTEPSSEFGGAAVQSFSFQFFFFHVYGLYSLIHCAAVKLTGIFSDIMNLKGPYIVNASFSIRVHKATHRYALAAIMWPIFDTPRADTRNIMRCRAGDTASIVLHCIVLQKKI